MNSFGSDFYTTLKKKECHNEEAKEEEVKRNSMLEDGDDYEDYEDREVKEENDDSSQKESEEKEKEKKKKCH